MTDQTTLLNKSSLPGTTYGGVEKGFNPADNPDQSANPPTYGQSGPYPSGPPGQSGAGPYPAGPPGQSGAGPYPAGPPGQSGAGPYPSGPPGQSGAGPYPAGPPEADQTQNAPSAPPLDRMDSVHGYETVSFDPAYSPPPSYDDSMKGPPPNREQISNLACITEEQARQALLEYVSQHCCYGKSAAINMSYRSIESSNAFHYTLETYAERRTTSWSYLPYTVGTFIDGPMNGPAPGAWDIAAAPRSMFTNSETQLEIPHTASVKPCHTCLATGRTRCIHCSGLGQRMCIFCSGSGHRIVYDHHHHHDDDHHHHHSSHEHHETCSFCCGTGRTSCIHCNGIGLVTCCTCDGFCQLKCYIKLTIIWTNHFEDHIVERTALPDELIRDVTGQTAFQEEQPRVWPVNHFPDNAINSASSQLVQKHAVAFPTERILMQRQCVRVVPVTQVYYEWKNKNSSYFVYGFENKVFCSDYPQSCCWGCVIL